MVKTVVGVDINRIKKYRVKEMVKGAAVAFSDSIIPIWITEEI